MLGMVIYIRLRMRGMREYIYLLKAVQLLITERRTQLPPGGVFLMVELWNFGMTK